jgi:hypothetical protein
VSGEEPPERQSACPQPHHGLSSSRLKRQRARVHLLDVPAPFFPTWSRPSCRQFCLSPAHFSTTTLKLASSYSVCRYVFCVLGTEARMYRSHFKPCHDEDSLSVRESREQPSTCNYPLASGREFMCGNDVITCKNRSADLEGSTLG